MSEDSKDSGILGLAGGAAGAAGAGYLANNHLGTRFYRDLASGEIKGDNVGKIKEEVAKKTGEAADAVKKSIGEALKKEKLDPENFSVLSKEQIATMPPETKTAYEANLKKYNEIVKPLDAARAVETVKEHAGVLKSGIADSKTVQEIHFVKAEDGKIVTKLVHETHTTSIPGAKHLPESATKAITGEVKEFKITDPKEIEEFFKKDGIAAKNVAHLELESATATRKVMGFGSTFKNMGMGGKAGVVGAAVVGGVGVKMAFDALFGSKKEGGYAAKIDAERSQAAGAETARA